MFNLPIKTSFLIGREVVCGPYPLSFKTFARDLAENPIWQLREKSVALDLTLDPSEMQLMGAQKREPIDLGSPDHETFLAIG